MKKILTFVVVVILICALCGSLFNLPEFDFFQNVARITSLKFNNPIDTISKFLTQLTSISEWSSQNVSWYEYIPKFFDYLGSLLTFPVVLVMDIAENLINGFRAILYFIGWTNF